MTDAYATLAARGVHHDPQASSSSARRTASRSARSRSRRAVIPQNAADQVTYALEGVIQHGTGTAAVLGTRPIAGKTGTAENSVDAWFCGYVPQLATCVWIGYPKAEIPLYNIEGVPAVFGGSLPAQIWHRFMTTATAAMPIETFPYPTIHRPIHRPAYPLHSAAADQHRAPAAPYHRRRPHPPSTATATARAWAWAREWEPLRKRWRAANGASPSRDGGSQRPDVQPGRSGHPPGSS